jgi:hypothetical protein
MPPPDYAAIRQAEKPSSLVSCAQGEALAPDAAPPFPEQNLHGPTALDDGDERSRVSRCDPAHAVQGGEVHLRHLGSVDSARREDECRNVGILQCAPFLRRRRMYLSFVSTTQPRAPTSFSQTSSAQSLAK